MAKKQQPRIRGAAGAPCPVCRERLDSNGFCWTCEADERGERREFHAWHEYVQKFRDQLTVIGETAERVCDQRELELIGADLWEWPDERTAEHLGFSVRGLREFREQTHEKIRAAIGEERIAEVTRRRRG